MCQHVASSRSWIFAKLIYFTPSLTGKFLHATFQRHHNSFVIALIRGHCNLQPRSLNYLICELKTRSRRTCLLHLWLVKNHLINDEHCAANELYIDRSCHSPRFYEYEHVFSAISKRNLRGLQGFAGGPLKSWRFGRRPARRP